MSEWPEDPTPEELWGDSPEPANWPKSKPKRIDASDLTRPLPAWHWLIWYQPNFRDIRRTSPEYLVGGTDDRAEADARATGEGYTVRENPVWRTLN